MKIYWFVLIKLVRLFDFLAMPAAAELIAQASGLQRRLDGLELALLDLLDDPSDGLQQAARLEARSLTRCPT